ncbi:MAG: class II glutamine amidotransferase, partial [Candidatus Thorarchaeota archaeon]
HVAKIYKEPKKASESVLARRLESSNKIKSDIIISHVRKGSKGGKKYKNTHPFKKCNYIFAHNGTLNITKELKYQVKDSKFQPRGDTDSELIFNYLLMKIKERDLKIWKGEDYDWLLEELSNINLYGSLNVLFSDGKHLFAYSDRNQHNHLSYIKRKAPFGSITLLDVNIRYPNLGYVNLDKEKDPSQFGFIIFTVDRTGKPTDENWKALKGGNLRIYEKGRLIYSKING